MDGIHDLGGRQGFGPIRYSAGAPAFHAAWEKRVNALYGMAVRRGIFNMDEYRHAIERMPPRHYLSASYYERSLTSLSTLCVEKGVVTREELETLAQGTIPLSEPSAPGSFQSAQSREVSARRSGTREERFLRRARPYAGYIRGKPGVVVSESPRYPFPDAHAHGVEAADEPTYDVAFRTEDLWPNSADSALVHVGVFQSYLERAT